MVYAAFYFTDCASGGLENHGGRGQLPVALGELNHTRKNESHELRLSADSGLSENSL